MRSTRGRYVLQRQPADVGAFGGRAAKAGLSYEAFVPASIADMEVRLSGVAAADVADAEVALMRLAHSSVAFPSLEALARRLRRSEAIASSCIEALRVSHRRLAEAEQGGPGGRYDEARRVLGNVAALDAAVVIGSRSDPITVDDLLSIHGALLSTSNVEEDRARAGQVRDGPVFIGGRTRPTSPIVSVPSILKGRVWRPGSTPRHSSPPRRGWSINLAARRRRGSPWRRWPVSQEQATERAGRRRGKRSRLRTVRYPDQLRARTILPVVRDLHGVGQRPDEQREAAEPGHHEQQEQQ